MDRTLETRTGVRRWLEAIPRAYAQIFFTDSPWVGLLLLAATAGEPATFMFGLLSLVVASLVARGWRVDGDLGASGYFGYNAVLVGAGIGHLYSGSWQALPVVVLAAATTVLLTCAARAFLTRTLLLPALSLPFLAVFWLLVRAAPDLGLAATQAGVMATPASSAIPTLFAEFLRCLGSVLFVPSIPAGALVALALLLHSRIASLLAFGTFALLFALDGLLPSPLPPAVFAITAANAMLLSIAVGGCWFVPSRWSMAWSCAGALACTLVTAGVSRPLEALGLPTLFLPFNLLSFVFLLAARERRADRSPKSVDFPSQSPEKNLDHYLNQRARFPLSFGLRFHLPFRGRWTCTQGIDGEHTHQGLWRHAFDFQVVGADGQLWSGAPHELSNYHCYKLPVLATAPGLVVKIENDIPDNRIGDMDLVHNWGNFVMLQHGPGLCSLVAHLSPRSIKVREGQQVGQGEVLGLCGNSGRSPTPHIHFHLQEAPFLGAHTLDMQFNDVVLAASIGERLEIACVPHNGEGCRNLEPNPELASWIAPRPGATWQMRCNGREESIRVDLDLFGQTRLRSSGSASTVCTRTIDLHLTHEVVGTPRSVLDLWRAALPRLPLEENPSLVWKDFVPSPGGWWARLAAVLLPRPGLLMSYTLRKDASVLVVEGVSFRRDKRGNPLLRTQITFDGGGAPASIVVRHLHEEVHATRAPNGAAHLEAPLRPLGDAVEIVGRNHGGQLGPSGQLN
jgi:urea transporter